MSWQAAAHTLTLDDMGAKRGALGTCACGWERWAPSPGTVTRLHREHAHRALAAARRQS